MLLEGEFSEEIACVQEKREKIKLFYGGTCEYLALAGMRGYEVGKWVAEVG